MTLKELREKQNLTQEELAKLIGVGQSAITQYEKKRRSPNVLRIIKLSKVLNVDISEIVKCFKED